jgi:DNA-binding CsgD family transcriptional regulator
VRVSGFLLALLIANVLLSVGLIVVALRSRRASSVPRTRLLCSALAVAGGALFVTVAARLGSRLVKIDVLPDSFAWLFEPWWYVVISSLTTILLVGGVWLAARVIAQLERVETALATLVDRLPHEARGSAADLTPRERDVLTVMAGGSLGDSDIAVELFISPSTAATHVRNIMKKADLHNRRELMLLGRHLLGPAAAEHDVRASGRLTGTDSRTSR